MKVRSGPVLPPLPYRPRDPRDKSRGIGLIGCGGITGEHLTAYRAAGYRVVALCDLDRDKARRRQQEYYPDAEVFTAAEDLLQCNDVEVVDIATHPGPRPQLIRAAIESGRHVLSQKPFVEDLACGRELIALAARHHVKLAVNQNGRWAPHFSYLREAVAAGYLGTIHSVHARVHWDHGWVAGTEFEHVPHLILYDFGIHWFDLLRCVMAPSEPRTVFASTTRTAEQSVAVPLFAQAVVQFDAAQASLVFDGGVRHDPLDTTYVAGSEGTIVCRGPNFRQQSLTITNAAGAFRPHLVGTWFPDGFHGAMGELLCAIEEDRLPSHDAATVLESLALCFAATASADRGEVVTCGEVQSIHAATSGTP